MTSLHTTARQTLPALVVIVAMVGCNDTPVREVQPTSVTASATTHASSRHIEATLDGEHCSFSGPGVASGDTKVTFENQTGRAAGLAFMALVDQAAGQAEIARVGTHFSVGGAPPPEEVQLVGVLQADPGNSATQIAPLTPGTYLIDCVTFTTAGPDEVWRVAVLEVE